MELIGGFFAFFLELLAPIDPFSYLHQLMNTGNPVVGAVVVGIPILAVLFAPVAYWVYWESAQDRKRRRKERARMATYRARGTENREAS